MAKQIEDQGPILDDIEVKVDKTKENAEKAKDEIKEADEMSRSNKTKLFCIIAIIVIGIAVIFSILLALFLG